MSETLPVQRTKVEEIDYTKVFTILWRQRKLIIFGTLAATLLATAVGFIIPETYRSEGFYQLGNLEKSIGAGKEKHIGITIPLYKKYASQFLNPDLLYSFASTEESFDEKDLNQIKKNLRTARDITDWIAPVFAYSRGDVRDLAQMPKEEANSILGLNLSYEGDSAQKAHAYVRFFGRYVQDCLLNMALYDYVKDEYSTVISQLSVNENSVIELQFDLLQNERKMVDIRAILTKYPQTEKVESQQLVSVQDGGFRFLGPVTQLVGIESLLADQRRTLAKLEREKEMLHVRRKYFSKCNEALNKKGRGGELFYSQLEAIKSAMFEKMEISKDTEKEVFNGLSIDLQAFDFASNSNCRFLSGPSLPGRPIRPQKGVMAIVALLLSAIFFLFLALLLSWWREKKGVSAPQGQAGGKKR